MGAAHDAGRTDAAEPVEDDAPSFWWFVGVPIGVVKTFRYVRAEEWFPAGLYAALALGCLIIALRVAYKSGYLAVLGWLLMLVAVLGLGARLVIGWVT